jgi:hypothetical protein
MRPLLKRLINVDAAAINRHPIYTLWEAKQTKNKSYSTLFKQIKNKKAFWNRYIRIRIRILLSNRGPTRGKVITVIHKQ